MISNVQRRRLKIVVPAFALILLTGVIVSLWIIGGKTDTENLSDPTNLNSNDSLDISSFAGATAYRPLTYEMKEVIFNQQDDETALIEYGKKLSRIMSSFSNPYTENALDLVVRAAETKNPAEIAKLKAVANQNAETVNSLRSLSVPPSVGQIHVNLINSLLGLAHINYLMSQIATDPATALESAQIYPLRLKNFFAAVNNMNLFFAARGIKFDDKDQTKIFIGL